MYQNAISFIDYGILFDIVISKSITEVMKILNARENSTRIISTYQGMISSLKGNVIFMAMLRQIKSFRNRRW